MLGVWLPAIQTDSMSWVWRISFSRLVLSTTQLTYRSRVFEFVIDPHAPHGFRRLT
jgi:hypothetical protein